MSRLDPDQWVPDRVAGFLVPRGVEAHNHQDDQSRLTAVESRATSLETSRTTDEAALAAFNLKVSGFGPTIVGGTPTLSSPFKIQAASVVGSSDVNGYLDWTFPVAFPTGVIAVLLTSGFDGAHSTTYLCDNAFTTTSKAAIKFINTTNAAVMTLFGPVRISALAIGW